MWNEEFEQDEQFVEGESRRRGNRRKLVCRCREVQDHCGCSDAQGEQQGHHDDYDHHDHHKDSHCDGCVCKQLKNLPPGTQLRITTGNLNEFTEVTFYFLDKKTCCAYFRIGVNDLLVLDCRKIKAIRFII